MSRPRVAVGLMSHVEFAEFVLEGDFRIHGEGDDSASVVPVGTVLRARCEGRHVLVMEPGGDWQLRGPTIELVPRREQVCEFVVRGMRIGVQFHWDQQQDLRFRGSLRLIPSSRGGLTVINCLDLEQYLESVIASEMSASSPAALLEAHAVISRSWLMAQMAAPQREVSAARPEVGERDGTIAIDRWYDRENHSQFDVCADDHCQRYQGLDRSVSKAVVDAVEATNGLVLIDRSSSDGRAQICDARFSKCCGGVTERFETAWKPSPEASYSYLPAVVDAAIAGEESPSFDLPLEDETNAIEFIRARPEVWCNIAASQTELLDRILPEIDQTTRDEFFRWQIVLEQHRVQELVKTKSGIDLGLILSMRALKRGGSGRIEVLLIQGSKRSLRVGRELEIRRILSPTHLLSSAFVVTAEGEDGSAIPDRFVLDGAGWGHGVGLCQIGAAAMAVAGRCSTEILAHYYRGATLERYDVAATSTIESHENS